MPASELESVLDDLYFPECLRWRDGRLWFSDMFAGKVKVVPDPAVPNAIDAFALEDLCGGLGWLPDGRLLVVGMESRRVHSVDDRGSSTVHADLSEAFEHPINDMYVDRGGRAFVSGYGYDVDNGGAQERVPLAVIAADGRCQLDANLLLFPNGIDLLDESTLVVAETFADQVSVLSLDEHGTLGTARPFAVLRAGDGPDGVSSDGRGGAWVACAFGERVVHINAAGDIDDEVVVAGIGVYDCLLAGPERGTLFIAVASHDEEYARRHPTGRILRTTIER